ncbi:hypothetical protein J2R77_000733 [Bradyrhizobium sp. USDA 4537]|nr:hypothetical protein [Bradyrhizobium sp. USDA 4537]
MNHGRRSQASAFFNSLLVDQSIFHLMWSCSGIRHVESSWRTGLTQCLMSLPISFITALTARAVPFRTADFSFENAHLDRVEIR